MSIAVTRIQSAALEGLGLSEEEIRGFLEGRVVVYSLQTETEPGIALVQRAGMRLRSGIVAINDPGGGIKTLGRFRARSQSVAKAFQLPELELFGVAVINARLESMLLRQGFETRQIDCPEELGDEGEVEIITRVFSV